MARDFYGKEIPTGTMVGVDMTCKVKHVLTDSVGGGYVLVDWCGMPVFLPARACTLLTEEKLREEISR